MEPVFRPFCPRFRTLPTFVTRWFRVTKDVPVLRVDHVTLERILPRVWEIVSSGVLMVKGCNGAKVYRHSDSIRASDPVRDYGPYRENPFCPQCWGKVAVQIRHQGTRSAGAFLVLKPQRFASIRKRGDAL